MVDDAVLPLLGAASDRSGPSAAARRRRPKVIVTGMTTGDCCATKLPNFFFAVCYGLRVAFKKVVRREYAPTHPYYGYIEFLENGKVVRLEYAPTHDA